MGKPEQAIVVAAGVGSRLRPLTEDKPKSLIEVGGESMLRRSLQLMVDQGISDVVVVVGYRKEMIEDHVREFPVTFVHNPFYGITNNMASLWFALSFMKGQFIYSHSDIVYDPGLLSMLVNEPEDNVLLVEEKECGLEEMKVQVHDGCLVASNKEIPKDKSFGEWTGLAKFSRDFGFELTSTIGSLIEQGSLMAYDTLAFTDLANRGQAIGISTFTNLPWIEIDTAEDLKIARELFSSV